MTLPTSGPNSVPLPPISADVRSETESEKTNVSPTRTWLQGIYRSLVFGLAHLPMGIPLGAALALSIGGLWFTYQYFRGGVVQNYGRSADVPYYNKWYLGGPTTLRAPHHPRIPGPCKRTDPAAAIPLRHPATGGRPENHDFHNEARERVQPAGEC